MRAWDRIRSKLSSGPLGMPARAFSLLRHVNQQQIELIRAVNTLNGRLTDIESGTAGSDGGALPGIDARELRQRVERIATEYANGLAHLSGALSDARSDMKALENGIAEMRLWLEKISVETGNAFSHADGRAVGLTNRVDVIGFESRNRIAELEGKLGTGFNRLFNESLPQLVQQCHLILASLIDAKAREVDPVRWASQPEEKYVPAERIDFGATIRKAQAEFPSIASAWKERLDEIDRAFAATKVGNAAHAGDLYSRMFKSFLAIHIRGRVLDVGCGVFGTPYYLEFYPMELISGIEPLPMKVDPGFECVQGINEYLPWPDRSFSTVVNATSLDHVLSLERSLDEMARVLTDDGTLVLWIGSIPGSAPFDPDSPDFTPVDRFHLFHFDVAWLDPILERTWLMLDRMELPTASFSHVFYALRKKHACNSARYREPS